MILGKCFFILFGEQIILEDSAHFYTS